MKRIKRLILIIVCVSLFGVILLVSGFASENGIFNFASEEPSLLLSDGYSITEKDGEFFLELNSEKAADGLHLVGEDYYYVKSNGALAKDQKVFAYITNGLLNRAYYRFDAEGKMVKGEFLSLSDGAKVYVTADGKYASGVTKIGEDYYFFNINNGEMRKNEKMFVPDNEYGITPGVYYFNEEGKMSEPPVPAPGEDATATGIVMYSCFSDNMILQRDQKISVWGKANANSGTVVVEFAGKTAKAAVTDMGTWKVTFDEPFTYSTEKRKMTIHGGDEDIVLNDILVGDVYYVIGQSNVHYSLQEQTLEMMVHGLNVYWDYNDSRNIRFYRNSALYTSHLSGDYAPGNALEFTEIMVPYPWMTPSEVEANLSTAVNQNTNHRAFSALGYLFAYGLSNNTDIPVGIIEIDAAGMPLTAFASNSLAEKWGDEDYNPQTGVYTYNLRGQISTPDMLSRFVYNQLIHPIKDFGTAGILWYQGESDALNDRSRLWGDDGKTYAYQFAELMEFYRDTLGGGQYDFPVYIIELPTSYENNGQNVFIDFGPLRAEQGRIPDLLSDAHLVSSADFFTDITYQNSLHPYIKEKQAQRAAKIVAADRYGVSSSEFEEGPRITDVNYTSDNYVTVNYTNVGTGLQVYNNIIYGFEVCTGFKESGESIWTKADSATLTDTDTVTVYHSTPIYGIRYHGLTEAYYPGILSVPGIEHLYSATISNSNNVPASAFVDIK